MAGLMSLGSSVITGFFVSFLFLVKDMKNKNDDLETKKAIFVRRINNGIQNIQRIISRPVVHSGARKLGVFPVRSNITFMSSELSLYVENLVDIMQEYVNAQQVSLFLKTDEDIDAYKEGLIHLRKSLRNTNEWNSELNKGLECLKKVLLFNIKIEDQQVIEKHLLCMAIKTEINDFDDSLLNIETKDKR